MYIREKHLVVDAEANLVKKLKVCGASAGSILISVEYAIDDDR